MRLMNMRDGDGRVSCVATTDDRVVNVSLAMGRGTDERVSVRRLLEQPRWRSVVRGLVSSHGVEAAGNMPDPAMLGPVVDHPRNVVVVGANTHSHLREAVKYTEGVPPQRPMILAKSPNAINGPYDEVEYPPETVSLDYEGELAVVIGQQVRRIAPEEVRSVIAGYTVANDVSARDYQLSDWEDNTFYRTHFLGKSFDGFCPCGPVIVTPDEFGDVGSKYIRTWVNDDLRQDATLDDLYFSIEYLVSYVSQVFTLEPGDILLTGSPAGVGAFHPAGYLKPGDVVRCEVEQIGAIENRVVASATRA